MIGLRMSYCMLCGKSFKKNDKACGGQHNGKPMCSIGSVKKIHDSDCAVHNEPAYPKGKCDCGVGTNNQGAEHEQRP